ncbi:MAG: hypothetical protein JO332_17835 [Planctomycetaceae bacterium]|nr:hypothetical protein [Planctomycetaceae bacterium]
MQSRWTYVATGVMTGIIGVLLTVVIAQNREPQAWAAPQSVDNTGNGLIIGTGGATTQTQDILWVIYKRPGAASAGKDSALSKTEKITLCCYQVANGARNIKLVGARDISFDMDIVEYQNDKPHIKEIIEELKKSEKK